MRSLLLMPLLFGYAALLPLAVYVCVKDVPVRSAK